MSTVFAPLAAGPHFPAASKWECAIETAASSSLASETLFEVASSSSDALPEEIYSTEALQTSDEVSCVYEHPALAQDLASKWRIRFFGHEEPASGIQEQLGKLDIIGVVRQHKSLEADVNPAWGFLDPHTQAAAGASEFLTPGMRMIVVSWMVEVAEEFRMQQETLHLAVGLLDRFLNTSQDVPRCVLQLLAVACILLAAKDLEVIQPSVEQLCAVTANHFKSHDLLRMERIVLDTLEFRLTSPSSYTFLHLLAQACSNSVTPAVLSLAMYLCELAVLEYDMHLYAHSTRAAAALLLAQVSVGAAQQLPAIAGAVLSMGIATEQLCSCMGALLRLQQAAYQHTLAAVAAAQAGVVPSPGSNEVGDLLAPLRTKFGAGCWCEVSYLAPMLEAPLPTTWTAYQGH
eukprot:GHUV01000931.1.p1 GENE.GHUV01000931.1~~GHUV01000931.1.p1  ORF type:complete len:403 (+),score=88.50 GHUV01000931.1:210-1418(+)